MRVSDPFLTVEALLLLAVLLLAWLAPSLGKRVQETIGDCVSRHLGTTLRQVLAIGLFALLARAVFLPWLGPPVPQHYDEFSLVLQAQTYHAGRITNPTPLFWQHFEEIHINLVPAYGSMYFPGRGLPLAAGLWLADHPWIGVWLSFILMAMATVWMLRGWVSAPLALLGGALVVLRLGVFSYWVNSYWGGAFTALGAMLVVGAAPRMLKRPGWSSGLAVGLGGSILLTTRPYEGALLCVPLAIYILVAMVRRAAFPAGTLLLKVGLPAALFAAMGGAVLVAHNEATTGDPLTTAYGHNRQTYAITPAFLIAPPVEGERRGPDYFRAFYAWENETYAQRHDPASMARVAVAKLIYALYFHIGFILLPAFLAGMWAARREWLLPVTTAVVLGGYLLETWGFPHYTAPVLPVVLIFIARGFAWLGSWQVRERTTGAALARFMPVAVALSLLVPALYVTTGWPHLYSDQYRKPCCAILQSSTRTDLEARLKAVPGRDIVLVADSPQRPLHTPILFNEPDIAASSIVWAHDLGPMANARLLRQFPGRRVWTLDWEVDGTARLRSAPGQADPNGVPL